MSIGCPLCRVFYRNGGSCEGCPVMQKTSRAYCVGSPWRDVSNVYHRGKHTLTDFRHDRFLRTRKFRAAATLELNFLKSLLPKK